MSVQTSPTRGRATGRLEVICERFESAWRRSERPAIESLLPSTAELRPKALVELVHIELELRLEAGEAAQAEEYFARFPELAGDRFESVALVGGAAVCSRYYGLRRKPFSCSNQLS